MSVKFKDYYEVLGVPRSASEDEIKKAFRKLARQHHPDVARNKKEAEERFKEINEAYEVLGDPAKRRKYDELGANWKSGADFRPPPGWESFTGGSFAGGGGRGGEFEFSGTGFSDFFEQLFGAMGRNRGEGLRGPGGFAEQEYTERGQDIEGDILVTLEEVMHGAVRSVSVRHRLPCENCLRASERRRRTCPECGGTGQVLKTVHHQVKVPPGVTEGQRLRLVGRGEPGDGGGQAGDLYLRVRLAKHPEFEVEGHDLIHELDLAPWEAVLGAQVQVPTLDGSVNIKIPPGTQAGQRLRVRGRGLASRAGSRGDLHVVAHVALPRQVSDRERTLWEHLGQESRFKPRE